MYKDLPHFEVMDQARSLHFGSHPCGNSVLGTNESIKALTADQMREYFARRYAPNNMVLACCGNFDFDSLCQLAQQRCGNWQTMDSPRQLSEFPGTMETKHIQNPSLARRHVCMLSPALSMQDPRRYAASLLGSIIGDDTGSRYYWALIEPALAEAAGMSCESMDGAGAFYSYICCDPDSADKVMDAVKDVFKDIRDNGITSAEMETARNKILSAMTIRCEQPMGRLVSLGFNWIYNSEYKTVQQDVDKIKSVTLDQITQLVSELNPGAFTMLSMGPK